MSDGRGLEERKERIRRLKLRAAAFRRYGREDDVEEVEADIALLERLPKEGPVAVYVEAVLDLAEMLSEVEKEVK